MKGSDIAALRQALGLDHFALAAVLGVHVSSVYRWETKRVTVDGIQALVLEGLWARRTQDLTDLGEEIRRCLSSGGGTLRALGIVIRFLER